MLCPVCRFENFEGEDTCANCGADLRTPTSRSPRSSSATPSSAITSTSSASPAPHSVDPTTAVADAIRLMHEEGTDCLLVSTAAGWSASSPTGTRS